jgi:hypothetical protein
MLHSFQGLGRFIDQGFRRLLFLCLALSPLIQSLGLSIIAPEAATTYIASAGFPVLQKFPQSSDSIMFHFHVKGGEVKVLNLVWLDDAVTESLDQLTIIIPYPGVRINPLPVVWWGEISGDYTYPLEMTGNYTYTFYRGNETEVRVQIGGWTFAPIHQFDLVYNLSGVVRKSLLPLSPSVEHTLNFQTPYIVELENVTVEAWMTLPPWVKVISSDIHYKTYIETTFIARYMSDIEFSQSFSDIPHGSMNLSIEWRPLNPIEIYLRGLWGAAYFFPIYFAFASLVFLIIRFRNPSLATAGHRGLLCTFLTYGLTIPIVYWVPPLLYTFGQFSHIPLAYYFAKRLLKKREAVEVALRSSLYPSFIISLPFLFLYFLYAIYPT